MNSKRIFASLALLITLSISALSAETILCFGDSITQGTYIDGKWNKGNSWVNMLEERSGGALKCINAGRSGRKTSDKKELLPILQKNKDVDRVIFYLGVNDLRISTYEVLKNCTINMKWMVAETRKAYGDDIKIVIIGLPGLSIGHVSQRFYKMGYNEEEQEMLDQLRVHYKKYASNSKCQFLDLWGVVSPQNYSDGLHPNLVGQAQTADAIWVDYINDGAPAKIACVGDSITFGAAIKNRARNCYPAQLQDLLGLKYTVSNFGFSARTLLKNGDHPYWREKMYQNALGLEPNYVIIKLGTNDVKPKNWQHKDEFKADLEEFAESFMDLPSRPNVFLSYPVPVQQDKWGINEKSVAEGVIPFVKEVAEELNLHIVDFHKAVPAEAKYFADGVHPNAAGARIMAVAAWEALLDREMTE